MHTVQAMARNLPDKKLVYLALKGVFEGKDAQIRNAKTISKRIQKHQHEHEYCIQSLMKMHDTDDIRHVAKALLKEQVFESEVKAKALLAEIAFASMDIQPQKRPYLQPSSLVPSLYPVHLPFDVQHRVLVEVQHMLERACYAFGQKKLSDVLQKEGWDCAEAVELSQWSSVFLTCQDKVFVEGSKDLKKPVSELLHSMKELRHTAVHRVRVSANETEQFIVDSESLAQLLQDGVCIKTISRWRHEIQHANEELKRKRDLLESRLAETRKQLAARRADLERQELDAVEKILREDKEYMALVGANLGKALNSLIAV